MMLLILLDIRSPYDPLMLFRFFFCICEKMKEVCRTKLFIWSTADYIIEKCEEGSSFWEKVPAIVNNNKCVVKDLEKGRKYKFRTRAQNIYGNSDPAETEKPTLAKDPFGKHKSLSGLLSY